jgi:hypothetical protein
VGFCPSLFCPKMDFLSVVKFMAKKSGLLPKFAEKSGQKKIKLKLMIV